MTRPRPDTTEKSPERVAHPTARTKGRPAPGPPKLRPTVRPTTREVSAPSAARRAAAPPPPPLLPSAEASKDDTAKALPARPIRVRKKVEPFAASAKPALAVPDASRGSRAPRAPRQSVEALAHNAEAPTERLQAARPTKLPLASPPGRRRVDQRSGTGDRQLLQSKKGGWAAWFEKEALMGSGAKVGLIGVLALIVLVVAVWDKSNADRGQEAAMDPLPVAPPDVAELTATARTAAGPDRAGPANGTVSVRVDTGVAAPSPAVTSAASAPATDGSGQATTGGAPLPAAAVRSGGARGPQGQAASGTAETGGASSPAPSGPSGRTYTVRPGDSLAKIAKRFYGDGGKYYAIVRANRDRLKNPNLLPLGVTLRIPAATTPSSPGSPARGEAPRTRSTHRPVPAGARTHVVQRGETLYQIAKRYLGSGSQHKRIFEANRDQMRSPDRLRAGMTLVIPARR